MELRPYQTECIDTIIAQMRVKKQRQLVSLPTGAGKTIIFAALIKRLTKGRALVLAHRDELIQQAVDKIRRVIPEVDIGVEKGKDKCDIDRQVVVGSVQTMRGKRLERWPKDHFTLVIVDEAHHSSANTYRDIIAHFGLGDDPVKGKLLLGVTATPFRGAGKQNLNEIFEEITYQVTIRDLVSAGFLCPIRGYSVGTNVSLDGIKTVAGDFDQRELEARVNVDSRNHTILEAMKSIAPKDQSVVFTVSVNHAHTLAALFDSNGIRTEAIWGNMVTSDRQRILKEYAEGEIQCLTNVQVLSEGWDCPSVSTIVMACPTKSQVKYMQCVGRGTRVHESKEFLKILDFDDLITKHSLCHIGILVGKKDKKPDDDEDLLEWDAEDDDEEQQKKVRTATQLRKETLMMDLISEQASIFQLSPFNWIELEPEHYYLKAEEIGIRILKDGEYWVIKPNWLNLNRGNGYGMSSLGDAISFADTEIAKYVTKHDCEQLVLRRARWRKEPAGEKQYALLDKYRIEHDENLTKGQSNILITRHFHKMGWLK